MKRLLAAGATLLTLANGALAADCAQLEESAKIVMASRQIGFPINEILATSARYPETDFVVRRLILAAYKVPIYDDPEAKIAVTEAFATRVRVICEEAQ